MTKAPSISNVLNLDLDFTGNMVDFLIHKSTTYAYA